MTIPSGVSVIVRMSIPPPRCNSTLCNFIRDNLGTPNVHLLAGIANGGVSMGIALGNMVLFKNSCNRPVFSLTEVSLLATVGRIPRFETKRRRKKKKEESRKKKRKKKAERRRRKTRRKKKEEETEEE